MTTMQSEAKQPSNGDVDAKQLLQTLQAVKRGEFSARMPADQAGITGKIYDTLNEIIELNEFTAKEFENVRNEVGREGKTKQRASVGSTKGSWKSCLDSFNGVIDDLVVPMNEMGRVIGAIAGGDLTQTMPLEVEGRPIKGALLRTAKDANAMIGRLSTFAGEVTPGSTIWRSCIPRVRPRTSSDSPSPLIDSWSRPCTSTASRRAPIWGCLRSCGSHLSCFPVT